MIRDPELIKQICIKDFDVFPEHSAIVPEDVDPVWAHSLFASRGCHTIRAKPEVDFVLSAEKWKELRPKLSPAFTGSRMKILFGLIEECAGQFVGYFRNLESVEVEMKEVFTKFTNDVIASTAFGFSCDSMKNPQNEFYRMGKELTNFRGINGLKFFLYKISPLLMKVCIASQLFQPVMLPSSSC